MTRIPTHPGELLCEDLMPGYRVKAPTLAKRLGVTRSRLQRLLEESASINADMALRLGHVFGTTPEFWMNLQTQRDLALAEAESADVLELQPLPKDAA